MMIRKANILQVFKFGIVGVLSTALHYGIYYSLLVFVNLNIAYSIGYGVGLIVNFFLSAYFTFNVAPNYKRGIGFLISNTINYGLHIFLLNLFLYLGFTKQIAPLFVFSICIPVNFLLVRYFFKR